MGFLHSKRNGKGSSENTVSIRLKPILDFQTTLFIANILNFKYGISSNSVIPAPAYARTGYGGDGHNGNQ